MSSIKIHNLYFDEINNELILVRGFSIDDFGQPSILYAIDEKTARSTKCLMATAWVAFRRWQKIGSLHD